MISLYLNRICHFSFAIKSPKSKPKKPRGKRPSRGYEAGNFDLNKMLAALEYIPGKPVSGEAWRFWGDCLTFSNWKTNNLKPRLRAKLLNQIALEACERMAVANAKNDRQFFKDIARLCDTRRPKNVNLRYWLLTLHDIMWQDLKPDQTPDRYYTPRELRKKAIRRGVMTEDQTERYLRQVCSGLGVRIFAPKS